MKRCFFLEAIAAVVVICSVIMLCCDRWLHPQVSLSREILSGGNFDVEKLLTLDLVRKKYIKYIRSSINIYICFISLCFNTRRSDVRWSCSLVSSCAVRDTISIAGWWLLARDGGPDNWKMVLILFKASFCHDGKVIRRVNSVRARCWWWWWHLTRRSIILSTDEDFVVLARTWLRQILKSQEYRRCADERQQ